MSLIAVVGMWHLGTVTAACLASAGHSVIGLDEDASVISELAKAHPPVAEPGLAEMICQECEAGRLRFSQHIDNAAGCDIVWIAFDTPVDDNDVADIEYVHRRCLEVLKHASDGTVFVISSQMPVGSIARLEREFAPLARGRHIYFACAPENLRLGEALEVFLRPDRVVLGVRDLATRIALETVYHTFTDHIVWMSIESAEMTKHSINAFLATSVCFINEIAAMCEITGANISEVERGLKTDNRIGKRAYLRAGGAIAGGTLARDVTFLQSLGEDASVRLPLINGVRESNELHKTWLQRRILEALGSLSDRRIAILGLTYKPGTSTLRRSAAVEIAQWLSNKGASVRAYDPQVSELPDELLPVIALSSNIVDVLDRIDALVVMTPWPEFQLIDPALVPIIVFDPTRFIENIISTRIDIRYYSVGGRFDA